jgi:hypothetical protein
MCHVECTMEKVAAVAHEGVAKTAKVFSIAHFLSENFSNVGFIADMFDGNCAISNPLASGILTILNVANAFGGHIVTPFDTGVIVVIQDVGWVASLIG